jgi:FKBP-type peptidyl-prolyl cis-trans isomerase 2
MVNSEKTTKKGDFIEISFIGKNLFNNEVFDTNITEEAKKINLELSGKPLIACIGQNMVVKGFDEALEAKELGKKYTIKLTPEQAFGKRQPNLTRLIPMRFFLEQKVYPQPGMTLALDNNLVKVVSVSGGRVMVDFNNPLAGKDIEYEFTINKIVGDIKEKVSATQRFLFGHEFEFEVDEKRKMIVFKDVKLAPILNAFREKFKELVGLDVEIFAKTEKAEDKKNEDKTPKVEANKEDKVESPVKA